MSGAEHIALLAAVIILGPLYFVVWWEHKDMQRKTIRMSLFGALAGPIAHWFYLGDYWNSSLGLGVLEFFEALIVAFLLIGLTTTTANMVLDLRSVNIEAVPGKRSRYVLTAFIVLSALILLAVVLPIGSLYASAIGFLVVASIIWFERKDLRMYSLTGGLTLLGFGIVCYIVLMTLWPTFGGQSAWEAFKELSHVPLPLEELLWLFSWGLVSAVLYEWRHGYGFAKRHK